MSHILEVLVLNWEDLSEDMLDEGIPLENIIASVSQEFRVFRGILTKALIQAGKIPGDTRVLSNDEAAFI